MPGERLELHIVGATAAVDNDQIEAVRNQRDAVAAMLGEVMAATYETRDKMEEAACAMLNTVFGTGKWPTFKDDELRKRLNARRALLKAVP